MYDNMRDCIRNKDYKWIVQARAFDKNGNDVTPKFGGVTVFDSFEALNKHHRLLRDSLAKSKFTEEELIDIQLQGKPVYMECDVEDGTKLRLYVYVAPFYS